MYSLERVERDGWRSGVESGCMRNNSSTAFYSSDAYAYELLLVLLLLLRVWVVKVHSSWSILFRMKMFVLRSHRGLGRLVVLIEVVF